MPVVADLHVHTTVSDGELSPDDVPGRARAAGLDAVAITDHDRVQPGLDAPVVERDGVTVVHGIELRVQAADGGPRVDLLGYGVEPTAALVTETERLQRNRVERTRRMARLIAAETGVAVDVPLEPGVGRPDVARAIAESDAPYGYEAAFDELIGDDGPCYVPRDVTSFERGVELLRESCALVGLAHPLRYDRPAAALGLAADLDAVERYYPYGEPVDAGAVDDAIERGGLLPTGGSDAHGHELGGEGLDADGWARVERHLPGTQC